MNAGLYRWCRERGIEPLTASRAHIEVYARSLEAAGRARATVARRLTSLAGFYRYATMEGIIDRSPNKQFVSIGDRGSC